MLVNVVQSFAWRSWFSSGQHPFSPLFVCATALLLYPPLAKHLAYGNTVILVFWGLVRGMKELESGRSFRAGLFFALVTLKTHLFIPVGLAPAYRLIRDGNWRVFAGGAV